MTISYLAHAYWRQIKAGNRTFESVKDTHKEQVKSLAKTDVENGVITAKEVEEETQLIISIKQMKESLYEIDCNKTITTLIPHQKAFITSLSSCLSSIFISSTSFSACSIKP